MRSFHLSRNCRGDWTISPFPLKMSNGVDGCSRGERNELRPNPNTLFLLLSFTLSFLLSKADFISFSRPSPSLSRLHLRLQHGSSSSSSNPLLSRSPLRGRSRRRRLHSSLPNLLDHLFQRSLLQKKTKTIALSSSNSTGRSGACCVQLCGSGGFSRAGREG